MSSAEISFTPVNDEASPLDHNMIVSVQKWHILLPGDALACRIGYKVTLPKGYVLQAAILPHLALEKSLIVAGHEVEDNAKQELKIILINVGRRRVVIRPNDAIAKLSMHEDLTATGEFEERPLAAKKRKAKDSK